MKKNNLLVLSLLASLALVGCEDNGITDISDLNSEDIPSVITESISVSSSEEQSKANDGLTEETAFTVDELLVFMKDYTSGQISTQEYYLTGEIASSTYNSSHNSYECFFKDHKSSDAIPVEVYSGVISGSTTYSSLVGATVVVKGYLQLYAGSSKSTYEMPYLSATKSPSGSAYSPTIKVISGGTIGTPEGQTSDSSSSSSSASSGSTGSVYGTNTAEEGYTEPANLTSITFDFTATDIETTFPSDTLAESATINGYEFSCARLIGDADNPYYATNYLQFAAKKKSGIAYIANTTPIDGVIYKVEVVMATEVQSNSVSKFSQYVVDLGTSALGQTSASSGATGSSGHTFEVYATDGFAGSYFSVSVVKGVSSTGKATWYNGQVAKIVVYYVPAE